MKTKRKLLCGLIVLAYCITLLGTTAFAASTPSIYPEQYSYTVTEGETVSLAFTIYHEFKNEQAHILVHQGDKNGPVIGSADRDFYNGSGSVGITKYTVDWDTTNNAPGLYTVEYWVSFYTLYEWHEPATHNYLLTVKIEADLCHGAHSYDSGKVTKAATCKEPGILTKTCTVCGHTIEEKTALGSHKWDGGVVKTAATATKGGSAVYTCTVCGTTKTEAIPAIFTDVAPSSYYADAVEWAYAQKVTTGTSDTTFSPSAGCTRGQVLTFLWRAKGCPEPKTTNNPFKDVSSSQYYYKPILWGVENGITNGTSDTTFSPEQACSYAHILTFIWRSQGKPGNMDDSGEWYENALLWAKNNGLLKDTLAEQSIMKVCPRCDVVTYLYRILNAGK